MSLLSSTPLLVTAPNSRNPTHPNFLPPNPISFHSLSSKQKPKFKRFSLKCASSVDSKKPSRNPFRFLNPLSFLFVFAVFLCVRVLLGVLPSDFSDRWRHLLAFSEEAESKVTELPYHLIQAVMASEDRRFLYHFGFDPFGIARAVVYYPNGGGGSTITQQLVKNIFLTSERKISRKFVEGVLSLIVEKRMSKWKILYSYLNKMYWGHGRYGIESASLFYFGKHPSLLNVGESALLAGILPAPEALNPLTNPSRAKSSQARALRRMVAAGFLDMETALLIVSQPLCLRIDGAGGNEEYGDCRKQIRESSAMNEIWDWEMASRLWEVREDMEKWAMRSHRSGAK